MNADTRTKATSGARRGKLLTIWTPEDKAFWAQQGQAIANINLWISVPALFLAFAVWQLWSARGTPSFCLIGARSVASSVFTGYPCARRCPTHAVQHSQVGDL